MTIENSGINDNDNSYDDGCELTVENVDDVSNGTGSCPVGGENIDRQQPSDPNNVHASIEISPSSIHDYDNDQGGGNNDYGDYDDDFEEDYVSPGEERDDDVF